jgi:hypothetical protein
VFENLVSLQTRMITGARVLHSKLSPQTSHAVACLWLKPVVVSALRYPFNTCATSSVSSVDKVVAPAWLLLLLLLLVSGCFVGGCSEARHLPAAAVSSQQHLDCLVHAMAAASCTKRSSSSKVGGLRCHAWLAWR